MMEQNVQQPLLIGSPARQFVTRTAMGNRIASLSSGIPATIVVATAMSPGVFVHDFLFEVRRGDQGLP